MLQAPIFVGLGVGIVQVRHDCLLVGHCDRKPVNRNLSHARQQILQGLCVQRNIHTVNILTVQRCVHDGGRQRMGNWISGHAIDAGGCVNVLDPISTAQFLRGNLTGSGFLVRTNSGESEHAACAHTQHAADDPLFGHAQSDQRILIAVFLQELHDRDVVREAGCG